MEIKAKANNLKVGPRKLRLLTKGLRGMSPQRALKQLALHPQKGVIFLEKIIKQARANAVNNFKLAEDNLVIKKIEINEGLKIKRLDKSHGARFDRGIIKKRTSHILLTLDEKILRDQKLMNNTAEVNNEVEDVKKSLPSLKLRRVNGTKS